MAGNAASECSETIVEIKIKMMDSQTFTFRVDKYVTIPLQKQQIASLTGVVSEQQRLICRGKLLTDDQILSAYHVEDGHALHLVVRQPVVLTPANSEHPAAEQTSSDEHNPHVMVGTIDLSEEEEDEPLNEINRIISAVFGRARSGFDDEAIDLNHPPFPSTEPDFTGTENSRGVLPDHVAVPVDFLQPPVMPDSLTTLLQYAGRLSQEFTENDVEDGHNLHLVVRQPVALIPANSEHPAAEPTSSDEHDLHVMVGTFDISEEEEDEPLNEINRIISAVFGRARSGFDVEGIDLNHPPFPSTEPDFTGTENSSRVLPDHVAVPVDFLQHPVMPDSLTTLLQYAGRLSQEFTENVIGHSVSVQNVGFSWSEGSTSAHSSDPRGLLRPESLAEEMSIARQLLVEQANVCLSQLAEQLESLSTVTDPLERSRIQSYAMRLGPIIQNLGYLLLDLGRTIMTLRMGQTPAQEMVSVGPPVFVSPTGPNPIRVQPQNLQPGASFGSDPFGAAQSRYGGSAAAANTTGLPPRNVDIRIRTASPFISRRDPTFGANAQSRVAAAIAAAAPIIGRSLDSHRVSSVGILRPVAGPTGSAAHNQNNIFSFPSGSNMTMLRTPQRGLHNIPIGSSQNTATTTNEDAQAQADDGNNPDRASSSRRPQSQQQDSKRQRMG